MNALLIETRSMEARIRELDDTVTAQQAELAVLSASLAAASAAPPHEPSPSGSPMSSASSEAQKSTGSSEPGPDYEAQLEDAQARIEELQKQVAELEMLLAQRDASLDELTTKVGLLAAAPDSSSSGEGESHHRALEHKDLDHTAPEGHSALVQQEIEVPLTLLLFIFHCSYSSPSFLLHSSTLTYLRACPLSLP